MPAGQRNDAQRRQADVADLPVPTCFAIRFRQWVRARDKSASNCFKSLKSEAFASPFAAPDSPSTRSRTRTR